MSPRTTVAVQTYYRVTLPRVDACIDIFEESAYRTLAHE